MPKRAAAQRSKPEDDTRQWLIWMLKGGGAHVSFDVAVGNFPPELCGKRPGKLPFSAWQLLEHMRIAQHDILDFCVNPEYRQLEWPDAFWPKGATPPDSSGWERSVRAFRGGIREMERLIRNPQTSLIRQIPWGSGQTITREALLLADHNAYHLGELVLLRRLLGAWPG
jgi:hypothetical protein